MEILNNNTIELEDADKFTIVKADIRQAKTVNGMKFKAIDKMIYCYLLGYKRSAENPESRVTNVRPQFRKIQAEHGVSKGTVESTMKTLEQMGLIIVTRKTGGHNIYDVVEFDQVVATHLEIKKDDFMVNREIHNADKAAQPKAPVQTKPDTKPEVKQEQPRHQPQQQIKQESDSNDDDFNAIAYCGDVSHDQQFENHYQHKTTKPVVKYGTHFEQLKSQGYVMNDNRWVDLSQDQQREIAKAVNACNSFHEAANKFMELVDEYTNLQWDDVPF